MKANYLLRNRQKYYYFKKVLILVIVLLLGAFVLSLFDRWIMSATTPVWKADNAISNTLRESIGYFKSKRSLQSANIELERKLTSLEIEIINNRANESEVKTLTELLGRKPNDNAIASTVLVHPPETPYDIIVVDAGALQSVELGFKVVIPEGPIVGTVSEVSARSSKVKLLSNNGEKTNAILERHSVPVELLGVGAGNFRIELPRDQEVEVGDRILTSSIDSQLIAVVEDIELEPTDSFKEVLARSPVNIFSLHFVFLIP